MDKLTITYSWFVFHVGDAVRIKTMEEFEEDFKIDDSGGVECPGYFNPKMKYMCGQVVHISDIKGKSIFTEEGIERNREDGDYWSISPSMILPADWKEKEISMNDWEQMII